MNPLTVLLISIGALMLIGLVSIIVKAVLYNRKIDREMEAMRRVLESSGGGIRDALEQMARLAVMQVHAQSISIALEMGIPVPMAYGMGVEWIGHIDSELNVLIYDNPELNGEPVDSATLDEDDLDAIFEDIKDALYTCAQEAKRYNAEHGQQPSKEYMIAWAKENMASLTESAE